MVVVLDELPYLTGTDSSFESVLQRVWDRTLEGRPVLLVVVGSDLAAIAALSSYDRPLYGRVRLERVVLPLNVAEVADVLGLGPADAVDAYLTVGGFPRVLLSWARGTSRREFVRERLSDPTSALVALSTARGGRATRYRVADPYLRFWLRFVGPALADVERGRADLAMAKAEDGWSSYRGRAVEPLVRQSLERLAPVPGLGAARDFGGYWTRANDVEIDLVGVADRRRVQHIAAVGSVKWRDEQPFSTDDAASLRRDVSVVPGADDTTSLVAVSRSGFVDGLDDVVHLGPDDLLRAWSG